MMHRRNRGFTLIEALITASLAVVLMLLVYTAFDSLLRVTSMDSSILAMDRSADRALNTITDTLRTAVLPVVTNNDSSELQRLLNDNVSGFGRFGAQWRQALRNGADCLAFTTPADYGGDGDFVDANMILELGVVLPGYENSDGHVPTGQYDDPVNNRLLPNGSLNPFLARLDPVNDLDIQLQPGTLDLSAARFAQNFAFPQATDAGYGIIRFVPHYTDSQPYVISESALGYDLNEDGDSTDIFVLGQMQIVYPNITRDYPNDNYTTNGPPIVIPLTGPNVLLQVNQDDSSWTPIFKLVRYNSSGSTPNHDTFDESVADGDYSLLIRLILCDNATQSSDPRSFGNTTRAITRQYETLVKLRNINSR